ncbi:FAD-binding protein [Oceanispirochaeta crateris]|uniref:FAD-binding protein n=2 Tax=Oceanispirochaeta crateris TaxID=2518645 RepID=A0A5C1QRS4_9SPIO|nr:FAD-binding protein [Oceanispirochaeta crateris]
MLPWGGKTIAVPVNRSHTLVVGSGAASLCCAERLRRQGVEDLIIITDNFLGGTSRNTGSDKQTYYKLADAGHAPDSPYAMAQSLAAGGCMHGDIALVEAQNSLNSFYHLVSLGVDFPHNPYGGYTGYKTDHDPLTRGVSLGPYTSKAMTEALAKEVERLDIPVLDHREVLLVLTDEDRAVGVLALNKRNLDNEVFGLEIYLADNTVLGVGGPGGLYETSVYPSMHRGGIGMALEAGAEAVNLTESQFGIASVKFRWNLSGSYQQVMPCYYSTDGEGNDRQFFLSQYFDSMQSLCHAIFLKGYQWPFDPQKIQNQGSSLIDLLVYIEREIKGRRVFMDFRINPEGPKESFSLKDQNSEVQEYLQSSRADGDTPIERLRQINEPAILLYKDHGIDLTSEALEIAVCAQHNNGGLSGDIWWESTNIKRLFPVGEVNGTHGIYRPGGSALNSGQVGALRASIKIARSYREPVLDEEALREGVLLKVKQWLERIEALMNNSTGIDVFQYRREFQKRMTLAGGFVRSLDSAKKAEAEAKEQVNSFTTQKLLNREQIPFALKNRQLALAQVYYLSAIRHYLEEKGGSRGSFLVLDKSGSESHPLLSSSWNFKESNTDLNQYIQVLKNSSSGDIEFQFVPCRALPSEEFWFETMWKDYRENAYLKAK